jgi:hypothetical protein
VNEYDNDLKVISKCMDIVHTISESLEKRPVEFMVGICHCSRISLFIKILTYRRRLGLKEMKMLEWTLTGTLFKNWLIANIILEIK